MFPQNFRDFSSKVVLWCNGSVSYVLTSVSFHPAYTQLCYVCRANSAEPCIQTGFWARVPEKKVLLHICNRGWCMQRGRQAMESYCYLSWYLPSPFIKEHSSFPRPSGNYLMQWFPGQASYWKYLWSF